MLLMLLMMGFVSGLPLGLRKAASRGAERPFHVFNLLTGSYFINMPQKSSITLLSLHGRDLNGLWAVRNTTISALSYASL